MLNLYIRISLEIISYLDVNQMRRRCPDSSVIGKAALSGYKLVFNRYSEGWQCGVADILKDPREKVWGLLFNISTGDLNNLDQCEGYPSLYRRIDIEVLDQENVLRRAISYEVVIKGEFACPSPEYMNIIRSASKNFDFPNGYIEGIERYLTHAQNSKKQLE